MTEHPTPEPATPGRGTADPDAGGDPACWLHRVCPACGRLADEEQPARCAACGARFPED